MEKKSKNQNKHKRKHALSNVYILTNGPKSPQEGAKASNGTSATALQCNLI